MRSLNRTLSTRLPLARCVAVAALLCCSLSASGTPQAERGVAHPGMPSNAEIFDYIQDITDFGPRRTGTEANLKTANYIANKFKDFGLERVTIETGQTTQWGASRWGLDVGGQGIPAFYMRHSFHPGKEGAFSTGPAGLKAPFVYVGDKSDLSGIDVKGKIVVADVELSEINVRLMKLGAELVHDPAGSIGSGARLDPFTPNNYPANFASAMDGGAVGFVGILSNYFDSNRFYNEDLAYFVSDDLHLRLPGLWLSHSDGETLKQLIRKTPDAVGRLVLEGEVKKVPYRTVVGYLPGSKAETLMIQSHHDSGFGGAVEDASGVSEVLALAKYYGAQPKGQRARSKMFVVMDSHFTGYEAHEDLARKTILNAGLDVLANVTVEHIAREMKVEAGRAVMTGEVDPRLFITSPAFLDLTSELVKKHDYRRSLVLSTSLFEHDEGLPTDVGPIQKLVGMPVISLISAPAYLYDIADTLDKVAVEQLQPTAVLVADLLDHLDTLPREQMHKDNK